MNNNGDRRDSLSKKDLVDRLVIEARTQARIHQKHLLPKEVGALGWVVINYPWQSLLIASLLTALLLEFGW